MYQDNTDELAFQQAYLHYVGTSFEAEVQELMQTVGTLSIDCAKKRKAYMESLMEVYSKLCALKEVYLQNAGKGQTFENRHVAVKAFWSDLNTQTEFKALKGIVVFRKDGQPTDYTRQLMTYGKHWEHIKAHAMVTRMPLDSIRSLKAAYDSWRGRPISDKPSSSMSYTELLESYHKAAKENAALVKQVQSLQTLLKGRIAEAEKFVQLKNEYNERMKEMNLMDKTSKKFRDLFLDYSLRFLEFGVQLVPPEQWVPYLPEEHLEDFRVVATSSDIRRMFAKIYEGINN